MWAYAVSEWKPGARFDGEDGIAGLRVMLDHRGAEGWELVTVVSTNGSDLFVFKRQRDA